MYNLLRTKKPKLENPRADVFTLRISLRVSSSYFRYHFPFDRKQYKVFSIHFKTTLPVTFTSIACWQEQAGGIARWKRFVGRDGGMKQKKWREAGWTKPMLTNVRPSYKPWALLIISFTVAKELTGLKVKEPGWLKFEILIKLLRRIGHFGSQIISNWWKILHTHYCGARSPSRTPISRNGAWPDKAMSGTI